MLIVQFNFPDGTHRVISVSEDVRLQQAVDVFTKLNTDVEILRYTPKP